MTRKIIDMTKDPRGGQFEYFRTMTDPWAGITVPVDITDLLASLNGRPFFLSYLYAVTRAANAVPQLRLQADIGVPLGKIDLHIGDLLDFLFFRHINSSFRKYFSVNGFILSHLSSVCT